MKRQKLLESFVMFLILYLVTSSLVYRFRHPELTETQLFLHLSDAVMWR